MNTERDELARLMNQEMGYIIDSRLSATSTAAVLRTTAAKVLAFLDRKPQQVTSREEVDALPDGSLILDSDPDVLVKRNGRWRSPDHPDDSFGAASLGLPATVLHVGGAE